MNRFQSEGQALNASIFSSFCKFQIKKLIFLSVGIKIIIISGLTINIKSTVLKIGVFQTVDIVYFKELTCQNRQWVIRS